MSDRMTEIRGLSAMYGGVWGYVQASVLSVVVAALPPLFSCSGDSVTAPAESEYTVTGRVVGPDSIGVAEVAVTLVGGEGTYSTETGDNGIFTLGAVREGMYDISCALEGYYFRSPTREIIVSDFTRIPNIVAGRFLIEPWPVEGAVVVSTTPVLNWVLPNRPVDGFAYEVKMGTSPDSLSTREPYLVMTEYRPEGLAPATTYYWQVIATHGDTVFPSPVWRFTTGVHGGTREIEFVSIPAVVEPYVMNPGADKPFSVTLSPYEISTTEVTNGQYAMFLNELLDNGSIVVVAEYGRARGTWPAGDTVYFYDPEYNDFRIYYHIERYMVEEGMENHPVSGVTWQGAKAFAEYNGWDLPTEAQWQYAASGSWNYEYPTDDGTLTMSNANCAGWLGHTTEGGGYPPNPFGIYNMGGNVSEWCRDYYGDYPVGTIHDYVKADPSQDYRIRVARGGNYLESATSAARFALNHSGRDKPVGFRVVR